MLFFWKMSLYPVSNDWANRELRQSNKRLLKLNILHALIRRAHATTQFNLTNTGNGLNAIVCLLCHKISNSPMQYWIKPNLLHFLVAIVVQLKFRSCWINLDFHYDWYTDLHTGYLIFHYRCIVIVHVHDRFTTDWQAVRIKGR